MKLNNILLIFTIIISSTLCSESEVSNEEWELYKSQFNKQYDSNELDLMHRNRYAMQKLKIEQHNKRYAEGLESYNLEINIFTDLLPGQGPFGLKPHHKRKPTLTPYYFY